MGVNNINELAGFTLSAYSKTDKTLNDWASVDYAINTALINPQHIKAGLPGTASFAHFDTVSRTYTVSPVTADGTSYTYMVYYIYSGDYGYRIAYFYNDNLENGAAIGKSMIDSLVLGAPDKNVFKPVSPLSAPPSVDLTKTITDKTFNFTITEMDPADPNVDITGGYLINGAGGGRLEKFHRPAVVERLPDRPGDLQERGRQHEIQHKSKNLIASSSAFCYNCNISHKRG